MNLGRAVSLSLELAGRSAPVHCGGAQQVSGRVPLRASYIQNEACAIGLNFFIKN